MKFTTMKQAAQFRITENEDDYFIVMECSRLNEGFKYTQIILTLGGCM